MLYVCLIHKGRTGDSVRTYRSERYRKVPRVPVSRFMKFQSIHHYLCTPACVCLLRNKISTSFNNIGQMLETIYVLY